MVIQTEAGGPMGGGNKVTSRIKYNFNVIKITHHNSIQIEFGNVKPKSTKCYHIHSVRKTLAEKLLPHTRLGQRKSF